MMDSASSPLSAQAAQSKSRWTPDSPHRALRMALASASLLSLAAVPVAAHAAAAVQMGGQAAAPLTSGVYVTILSPNPGTPLAGVKQVEIRAYYESSFGVSGLDLFIDGNRIASQQLAKPEERGEISFVVEASALRAGAHSIVVRATATDEEVSSARAEMSLPSAPSASDGTAQPTAGGQLNPDTVGGPSVEIVSPGPSESVQGIVEIKVDASDASGKAPYVSLFVDHQFKTLRNFAPYTFDLDTNHLTNGKHTIEVWGYNDAQKVTPAKPLEIDVNNPGGHTFERHDLLDDAPGVKSVVHVTRGGAVISSHLPPASHVAAPARIRATETSSVIHKAAAPGVPSIAHTARKAMSRMIAKADRLASLGSTAGLLDPAGQSESSDSAMTAPAFAARGVSTDTFETRTFAAPIAPRAIMRSHSVARNLRARSVPALRNANRAPVIAGLNPGSPRALSLIASSGKLEAAPGGALDSGDDTASILPDSAPTMPKIASGAAVEQPKIKIHLQAKPLQIASADLGQSGENKGSVAEKAILEPAPQKAADKSRIEAESRKPIVKTVTAEKSKAVEAGRGAMVALADFRPHDVAALRGAAEVMVNDRSVALAQPLQDRGAILFAPIRQIIEQQGGTLNWNGATRQVSAVTSNRAVMVTIGSRTASVNNQTVKLNSAPYLYNDRTMLPLDFFQKALNAKVSYDGATGHLLIQSK